MDFSIGFNTVYIIKFNPTNLHGLTRKNAECGQLKPLCPQKHPKTSTHFIHLWLFGTEEHHGLVGNGMQWVSTEYPVGCEDQGSAHP